MRITYQGKELDIELQHLNTGTRVYLSQWDGENLTHRIDGILHILQTDFEILCDIAAELFGDSIHAESLAELMGVPFRFSDDSECDSCGRWEHYEEGQYDEKTFSYLCSDCLAIPNYPNLKIQIMQGIHNLGKDQGAKE